MKLKEKINWINRGYADAREGVTYKRSPDYPIEILQLNNQQAPEEVGLYWEGWNTGIKDNIRIIMGHLSSNTEGIMIKKEE